MTPIVTLIIAFILAVAAEGGVEILFGQPLAMIKTTSPYKSMILTYIGVAAGVFLAIFYQVDMIYSLGTLASETGAVQPSLVGYIMSGLVIGRGSNYVHDFAMRILASRPAVAEVVATIK